MRSLDAKTISSWSLQAIALGGMLTLAVMYDGVYVQLFMLVGAGLLGINITNHLRRKDDL